MEGESEGSPSIARKRVLSSPRPIGHVWVYSFAALPKRRRNPAMSLRRTLTDCVLYGLVFPHLPSPPPMRSHPPPRECSGGGGLLAGSRPHEPLCLTGGSASRMRSTTWCAHVADGGDELVNQESTSALTHDGIPWHGVAESSHPWRQLPPVGAPSLHGKEGVDGSSPSEGLEQPLPLARSRAVGYWSRGVGAPQGCSHLGRATQSVPSD